MNCTSDAPVLPLAPEGWTLLQRNARLIVQNLSVCLTQQPQGPEWRQGCPLEPATPRMHCPCHRCKGLDRLPRGVVSPALLVIFVSVQPSSTTLFGVPFPLFTPQKRRDSQIRTMPKSARFECCARQHTGHGGHFGKTIKERVPGLQRDPKA